MGGAVAGFLPVEGQLDRHALAHPGHLRTVPALDPDLQPLHPVRRHRGRGLARPQGAATEPLASFPAIYSLGVYGRYTRDEFCR